MGEYRILTLRAGATVIKSRAPVDSPFAEDQDAWAGLLAEAGKVRMYRDNKLLS